GIITKYRYNASTNTWEIVEVTLPIGVVTVQADRYPFLQNIPTNFLVIGPNNFLYRYDEALMSWLATPLVVDPCILAKSLEQTQSLKDKMSDLQSKTGLNYETGYTMKRNIDGSITYTGINGTPNAGGIDFSPSSAIDGYIHTHYTGLLSIFSPDDMRALYTLMNNNLMGNPSNFTAGVVTASGTSYLLMINDIQQFQVFSQSFLSNENSFNIFSTLYSEVYNIKPSNTVDQNETSLLQLLQVTNSGLKLLKGNTGVFDDWKVLGLDQNNSVTSTDCN
ncbi:MAG: hypothetical protein ORN54_07690, partial [Cyclobacteriaceae bacterium]|nr:hypothetical protein [Cyclobacteriaceae bacterium]